MGYKIYYPSIGKRKYPMYQNMSKWVIYTGAMGTITLVFLLISLWQGGIHWLLPGDPEVTGPALQALIDSLRDGEALGEAVTAFCREVIAGAR